MRKAQARGLPVYYGDATSEEALGHARADRARLVVLLMNDPQAARRVVDTAKRVAPGVPVLMRTRYLAERPGLLALGARDVVAEEVEGAVEMIARMLRTLEVPRNVIDASLREVRDDAQTSERKQTVPRPRLEELRALGELKIESALVQPGSRAAGASPSGLRLRSETGALVVGVQRGAHLLEQPDPTVPFEAGDVVYFVGTRDALVRALALFDAPPPPAS